MLKKIIQQGAEATIFLENNLILKQRTKKTYRIKEIDERIRKLRTRKEGKILEKLQRTINIPKIFDSDENKKEIKMEFINGEKLSRYLDKYSLKKQLKISNQLGKEISKLHSKEIIHGDLTTSNMIFKENEIYLIDFGLGFHSSKIEDMAVDLYLLQQALEAKHFQNWKTLFKEILEGYKQLPKSNLVLNQLKKVERRRRYKH